MRPGKNLVRVGWGLVALALVAFLWRGAAFLVPAALLAAAWLAYRDYHELRRTLSAVALRGEFPVTAGRNLPFTISVHVTKSESARLRGYLRCVFPPAAQPEAWIPALDLPPGANTARLQQSVRIASRGLYAFGPVWLRCEGGFGLLEAQRQFDLDAKVQVLPEGLYSKEQLSRQSANELRLLEKQLRTWQRGVGTEFESISEFRPGDDPRRIDWRSTARTRRLTVRRYQVERCRDLIILLDCGRLMGSDARKGTKLDCAVDSALLLARSALQAGDRCGLGMFDDRVLGFLQPIAGTQAMLNLTRCVYDVQSRWRETDFGPMFATLKSRHPKRSLVFILSDIIDAETSDRYRVSLATLAERHVVLFVALQTPILSEQTGAAVTNVLDGYRKAVTFRMLRERERALHTLRRSGVHVLDVTPSQLTVPLVNRFVELRKRNLL